jgi:hypothetical protein
VVARTRRVGGGPIEIVDTQRVPFEFSEVCEFCGGPAVVDRLTTNGHQGVRWPEPILTPTLRVGLVADEVLPAPPEPLSLEARVAALERTGADR